MTVVARECPSPVAIAKYEIVAKVVIMAVMTWKSLFCYAFVRSKYCMSRRGTYNWDAPCHGVESQAGQEHDHEDDLYFISIAGRY